MRLAVPLSGALAALVAVAGLAGLVRGAIPLSAAGGGGSPVASEPITVTNAYVREPASPDLAAAYFTVNNTTSEPDTLTTVITGAGQEAVLHSDTTGSMTLVAGGVPIPPHSSVTLKPGVGHVMIEKLYGTLAPGETVDLELSFEKAGTIVVQAPVIGVLAPAPTS